MAAASPIIHCMIATRVFRSLYCLQRKQQHQQQQRLFSRTLQLLMPHQMKNENSNRKGFVEKYNHEGKFTPLLLRE